MRELRFDNGRAVDASDRDTDLYCLICGAKRVPEADAEPHADDCRYAED